MFGFWKRFQAKKRAAEERRRHHATMERIDYSHPLVGNSTGPERRRVHDYGMNDLSIMPASSYVPDAYRAPDKEVSGSHGFAHASTEPDTTGSTGDAGPSTETST